MITIDGIWVSSPKALKRLVWCYKFEHCKRCVQILNRQCPETRTVDNWLRYFKYFCDYVSMNPKELIEMKDDGEKAFLENSRVDDRVRFKFAFLVESLDDNLKMMDGSPSNPKYRNHIRNQVSMFMLHNKRVVKIEREVEELPNSRQPLLSEIYEMEKASDYIRDKALIWFFASTGLRPSSVNKLTWRHLKPTGNSQLPIVILTPTPFMKGGKGKRYKWVFQLSFLHDKAWNYMQQYKGELQEKLKREIADNMSLFYTYSREEPEPQPFKESGSAYQVLRLISGKAWGNIKRGIPKKRFSPTDFRHFFSTKTRRISRNKQFPYIDHCFITGHSIIGVQKNYQRDFYLRIKDLPNPITDWEVQEIMESLIEVLPNLK